MILNHQRKCRLGRTGLEHFLAEVQERLGVSDRELSVAFVSDRRMADLNHRFRGKPQPTDVLSFPVDPGENGYLGDVVISAETARRNARRSGRSLREELRILILHGVLHLLGYDHETDRGQMNRLERKLRRVWELR